MIGSISMFAGNFAVRNFAFCNGQLIAISQNTALFSILGTMYGGDGRTTFALPNLQGRVPIHFGQGAGLSSYTIGEMAGTETTTLLINNMPAHNHTAIMQAASGTAGTDIADGNALAHQTRGSSDVPQIYVSGVTPNIAMHTGSVNVGIAGGSQPFSIIQPFLVITFQICLYGIFPSRN